MELLSTGHAASIMDVHESTIKRWCDAGELPCSYTEGGHRRIALDDLLAFARSEMLDCPLLVFGSWATDVWKALRRMQKDDAPEPLADLLLRWLQTPWTGLPGQLLVLCLEQGIPLTALFDDVLRPVLYRIGDGWKGGCLGVGDEHRMTSMLRDALVPVRRFVKAAAGPPEDALIAVVGCAGGTHHEMGALMARIVLEAQGWEVVFLGGRVPVEEFVLQQQKFGASLVGVSVTPPLVPSDAKRIVRSLSGFYDADRPFHVALGGQVIGEVEPEDVAPHPFASCELYASLAPFETWLRSVDLDILIPAQ